MITLINDVAQGRDGGFGPHVRGAFDPEDLPDEWEGLTTFPFADTLSVSRNGNGWVSDEHLRGKPRTTPNLWQPQREAALEQMRRNRISNQRRHKRQNGQR